MEKLLVFVIVILYYMYNNLYLYTVLLVMEKDNEVIRANIIISSVGIYNTVDLLSSSTSSSLFPLLTSSSLSNQPNVAHCYLFIGYLYLFIYLFIIYLFIYYY
jgi:hypothetical protein